MNSQNNKSRIVNFHSIIHNPNSKFSLSPGFTIVELLIVIVIIGILATIVIVAYNGITTKARQATLQSDLSNSRTKLEIANASNGQYPSESTVNANKADYLAETNGNTLTYHTDTNGTTYCISAIGSDNIMYVLSNLAGPYTGNCTGTSSEVATEGDGTPPPPPAPAIQTITTATCPTTMTRVQDARDNHTYWVQKLADGKCWMLTNLAYAGGGTNTYSDVIPTGDGNNGTLNGPDNSGATTYTLAKYYIPTGANVTTEPTAPSTSTNGTGQYGYLYNWCAAMGGQTGNGACSSSSSTQPNVNTTICPANWRLPTGNGGEFAALNTAINSGKTNDDQGLRSAWLAQYGGNWYAGFYSQGSSGYYWSSAVYSTTSAYNLYFYSTSVGTAGSSNKYYGRAVRCLAAV